ncbi:MAG: insulinase family protein [Theionarchaea archaeon]|nr:insulinase family protein [Theionarchaea archaeon]
MQLLDNLEETTLGNGLTVLTKEIPSSSAITNWLWYRAGSRNEIPGITGASHWVEHMLFKGTKKFTKDKIDRLLSKHGGAFNAFTSDDYTAYFETLPAKQLKLALEIEADRMQSAIFDPKEVESERTVILSEREGSENQPTYLLYEEVQSAAFRVHPYHNPVIGWTCDLKTMTRDDLYNYYRTKYSPDNAILVLVGRFDREKALQEIENLYGSIPSGQTKERQVPTEPPQRGERRVVVKRPGNTEYIIAAFHTPDMNNPDIYPLMLLDAIMSGAKAVRSGPGFERSGRLYKSLVEKQLAASAFSNFRESTDPNLLTFFITVRNGIPATKVEKALLGEIDKIAGKKPRPDEMKRALTQTQAQFAYATDGVTNQAYLIGAAQMRSGYRYLADLQEKLSKIEGEDICRVAETYLNEDNRTMGIFYPEEVS